VYWTAHPVVREYVNECVTGAGWAWPLVVLKAGWTYNPLARGISIGCGTGELERAARKLRVCERIDAYDVSADSIGVARQRARDEGERWTLRYRVADCDAITLPRQKYDIAFIHGSLHHIADPDRLLKEISRSLKPHGLFYIDDYIGPSRDEWTDEHLVQARQEFEKIDDTLKLWPVNPPLDWTDPSEMIRSSRIEGAVRETFEMLHYRPYWGNLLFPLLCCLDGVALGQPQQQPLLRAMIEREKELVSAGVFARPLFAVMLARKKPEA
jgi:SAM-dependent methyltransferase